MNPQILIPLSTLGAIALIAHPARAAVNNLLISDAFGNNSFSTAGLPQQETATAAGTITTAGSLAVTITSATVAGSPLTINVPVALNDTAATWSPKVVAALNATPAVTARFSAGGTAPAIVLTGNPASPLPATDGSLNIEIANGTAAGITPVVTSVNTRAASPAWTDGSAPAPGNSYFTGANLLRTPAANANVAFLGDSLQLDPRAGELDSMLYKVAGNRTVTINNLILNGGILTNGENATAFTLAGNVNVIAPSGLRASDGGGRSVIVTAPVSGGSRLYMGSNATPQANTFTLAADNSGFSGGFSLGGTYTNNGVKTFNASSATLRVGHANAFGTGTLELKEGTLNLSGFSPAGLAAVQLPDAATPVIVPAGGILTATNFTFGTTTGVTLRINTVTAGNPVTPPLVSTNLAVNGPSPITLSGTKLSVASGIPLIGYTGTVGGLGGAGALSLVLPPGVGGTLVNNPGVSINADITDIEFIKWTNGATTGLWNINGDLNWKTNVGLADSPYNQNPAGGHSVLFNQAEATASPVPISIPAAVSPNAIAFNNPTKDYAFSGQAITGTAALVKDGAGTVTFANACNASGGVTLNEGKIVFSASGPAGSAAAPVATSIAAGATLEHAIAANQNQGATSITGGGILRKSGAGTLTFNNGNSSITLAAGGLIDVQGGKLQFGNFDAQACSASANQSDMIIAATATFDAYAGNVTVDSLTGSGTYQGGYFGPRTLTVGINGASSTFSGTIKGNGIDGNSQTQLIKRGNGTLTLTGTINARGAYGGSSLEVRGGTTGSPSTLDFTPADPASSTGYTGGGIYFSPGSTDVTVVNQTAGTITGSVIAVGEYGQATYNLSGGTVNAGRVEFAWNGGGSNGPVQMDISGSTRVNVNSNGNILMGQYWGRNITINQSGGVVAQFSDAGVTRGGTGKMRFFSGNQNVTWNLSGGTLSLAGMERGSGGGYGGGNGILNLNGGILQITNASFAAPTGTANGKPVVAAKVLGDDVTPNSGARLDPYGLGVTFAAPVQHGSFSTFDGGLSVESSLPGGSLTLAGVNTYTGDTTVATGNTLVLADDAELAFVVAGLDATRLTGAGTATLAGDFRINFSGADTSSVANTWTLVNVASRSYDPVTFTLKNFTEGPEGVWKRNKGGFIWTFTEATGVLSIAVAPPGYATWIGLTDVADDTPEGDPDFDGMSNLLEYVLNGDPENSDPDILPDLDASSENFVFTFTRRNESKDDTTQVFQHNGDLGAVWAEIAIPATSAAAVAITPNTPSAGLDRVQVTVAKGSNTTLFGRLKATRP